MALERPGTRPLAGAAAGQDAEPPPVREVGRRGVCAARRV